MLTLFILQKWFNAMKDTRFKRFWERRVLGRIQYYLLGAFMYYITAVIVIVRLLLWGNDSFVLGLLVIVMVSMVYGYYFLQYALKIFAVNTNRYLRINMGQYEDDFDKSNVVN